MQRPTVEQVVAEFVGTLALVFIGAGAVAVLGPQLGGQAVVGIALAHGLVLAIMVSNLGHISGGHFNPAVTVAVWVAGRIGTLRGLVYVVAQLLGAAAGAGLLRWALPETIWQQTALGLPQVNAAAGISDGKAVLLEAVLTFFLVFTVFAAAVDERGAFGKVAGLTIGLVLTMDILVGGPLTGASMNPARTFGPALVAGEWGDFWVYVAGPLAGAIIAASLYWLTFLRARELAPSPEPAPARLEPEGR
ncbi:MAG TPA: MIP family channel protein [Actinomycetota bacterium]|nr:MIP family channel protein [Actinomycetota bacterium]